MTALQGAWSAIAHSPVPTEAPAAGRFACAQLVDRLEVAVRIGHDTDTVALIAVGFRLLHCVAAQSRTPTVATRCAVLRGHDPDVALRRVAAVLPAADPRPTLRAGLRALGNAPLSELGGDPGAELRCDPRVGLLQPRLSTRPAG